MAHWTYGLATAALVCGVGLGGMAVARGLINMDLPRFAAPSEFDRPAPSVARYEDGEAPVRAKPKRTNAAFGYGKAICVRLCDGSFFPTGSVTGGDAACAAQCPDAPTALYTMPTDRIEDAVSSAGVSYTKLPVAKRYQTTVDSTCACHRETVASRAKDLLTDGTLRKGDVVMTADGFRVYEGSGYGPTGPKDFVALSRAPNVPKEQRTSLAAMERASAGSPALSGPSVVVSRPKGNVTVDNGAPAPAR